MFHATCLTISLEAGTYLQITSFYWLLNRNIARQVVRGMLHCAMAIYSDNIPNNPILTGFVSGLLKQ